jgi:TonB family protein
MMIALVLVTTMAVSAGAQQLTSTVGASGTDQPIAHVGENGVKAPVVIKSGEAEYPDDARIKNLNGRCAVSVIIDAAGKPRNAKIIRCSDPSFESNSLKAVSQYKFRPATTVNGEPVAVNIPLEILYSKEGASLPEIRVNFALRIAGDNSNQQDAGDAKVPSLKEYSDQGYRGVAWSLPGGGACDVDLTIGQKGKPSDPKVGVCETEYIGKVAVKSLLNSHFKPAIVNGEVVPTRVTVHLEFGGFVQK